jgi:tRNA dimethylallyltransferase
MGATATGKSAAAIALAHRFAGEVVSMDSRQVYRGMDIGTGKVLPEEREGIPHHLIDILEPTQRSSAGRHAALAIRATREIHARGRLPLLVGGTGLYFRALFQGLVDVTIPQEVRREIREAFEGVPTEALLDELRALDPARAAQLAPRDRTRITRALEIIRWTGRPVTRVFQERHTAPPDLTPLRLVLTMPRPLLRETVAERTRSLFDRGWPGEVRRLLDAGVPVGAPGMNSLGYRPLAEAITAGRSPDDVLPDVIARTRQYAKRQETFFRREPDAGWVDVSVAGWARDVARRVAGFAERQ